MQFQFVNPSSHQLSLPPDLATNRVQYKLLEQELLQKVCQPCSITGGKLDRMLFSNWKEVN